MGNYRPFLQGPLPVANYTRIIIPGRFWTRPPSTKSTRMASSATPLHDSLIELAIPDAHAHAIKWYLKLMQSMPPTLGKQRSNIIASDCNISIDEVSSLVNLLQDCCCDGFCDTDTTVVLTPPAVQCLDCERTLVTNHVTKVRCYTCTGASFATKITLRCKHCSISYNYSQFGKKSENGFRYYPVMQEYVEASDTVFVHRQLLEMQCCLA